MPRKGRYLLPDELDFSPESTNEAGLPLIKATGSVPNFAWEKMSKSKYNGVEPGSVVDRYGADVTRLASMFVAPPEQALEWDEFAVAGQARWLERIKALVEEVYCGEGCGESGNSEGNGDDDKVANDVRREIHQTIQTLRNTLRRDSRSTSLLHR